MNINDPQKFNLVLKETVEKRLGDGYDVSFSEVKKITESYPSLCILNLCGGIGYNINLEQLYGYYREGKSTEELKQYAMNVAQSKGVDLTQFMSQYGIKI